MDDGYERTLHEDDIKEFEEYLPLGKRFVKSVIMLAEEDEADRINRTTIKLYRCSEYNEKYRVTEVKNGPLKQTDLDAKVSITCGEK